MFSLNCALGTHCGPDFRLGDRQDHEDSALHPVPLNIVYGICRLLQSLHFHLESRWLTNAC